MHRILVIGAGKIGSLISVLLANSNKYKIFLADVNINNPFLKNAIGRTENISLVTLDAKDSAMMTSFLHKNPVETVVSSLPYYCNKAIVTLARDFSLNYFDLTEDRDVASTVATLATQANSIFVPQCGLAPGFVSIAANNLMNDFSVIDTVKLRVGALPLNISNALQYSLTWSTDGLINEYGNLCAGIENSQLVTLQPLDDLEEIKIDGLTYEAFNTSGGIGTLAQTYLGRVKNINYKTIRYPGHCAKMRFLMNDLNLNHDRSTLKRILENALPQTLNDVVVIYISVNGIKDGQFTEKNYVRKFYPKIINDHEWSAIQLATASSLCTVLDIVNHHPEKYSGFVKQEQFSLAEFSANLFGQYYNE